VMAHKGSKDLEPKGLKGSVRRAYRATLDSKVHKEKSVSETKVHKVVKVSQAACRVTKAMLVPKVMTGLVHKACRATKVTLVQLLAPPLLTW